jgi:Ras-related protein Rab-8A
MKAQKKKDESDYTVKIVIIGDSGVGKTNILLRFCDNQFKTIYTSTIGVDFKIKILPINGYKIKLQIWDTAGQERFKNVNQTYYKGAISVILVYAVDNPESFDNVGMYPCLLRKLGETDS